MFRPNRIGTPQTHTAGSVNDTSAFTLNENAINLDTYPGNVINSAPVLDFGRSPLHWTGSARTLTSGRKWIIGQQFTITQPSAGDVRGLELSASIFLSGLNNVIIRPILCRLTSAGGATLAAVTSADTPSQIAPLRENPNGSGDASYVGHSYITQAIVYYNPLAGTYLHGFELSNLDANPMLITWIRINAAIRQLNDQQDIRYADTLR